MSDVEQKKSPLPPDHAVVLKQSFDWYVEVSKARLTIALSLGLATMTVTGFAVQTKTANLFFLASLIPLLAFSMDFIMKRYYGAVFLYKAATLELMLRVPEPTAIAFLDFTAGPDSKYYKILSLGDEKEKRRRFCAAYVWRGLGRHLFAYGLAFVVEVALGIWAKHIFV